MPIYRNREILGGSFLIIIAAGFLATGRGLEFGSFQMMGPGFVPLTLAVVLLVLGLAVLADGIRQVGPDKAMPLLKLHLKPIALVLGAIIVFAIFLPSIGYVFSAALLVFVAGIAAPDMRWKEVIASSVLIPTVTAIVFIEALGLPLPLFPEAFR